MYSTCIYFHSVLHIMFALDDTSDVGFSACMYYMDVSLKSFLLLALQLLASIDALLLWFGSYIGRGLQFAFSSVLWL